jgi:hypothetical protein
MSRKADAPNEIQQLVNRLLNRSWICEVSLRNEWPEVGFERPNDQLEARLWIDSDWRLEPSPPIPEGLSERQRQLVLLGELLGQEVKTATCISDGGLDIEFASSLHLIISGTPSDKKIIEPWILSERGYTGGLKVIGTRGDGGSAIEANPSHMANENGVRSPEDP